MCKDCVEIGIDDLSNSNTSMLVSILNLFIVVLYVYYLVVNKLYMLNTLGSVIEVLIATSVLACNVLLFSVLSKRIDMFLVSYYLLKGYTLSSEVESELSFVHSFLFGLMVYDLLVLCLVVCFK